MDGAEIHAQLIENILAGTRLKRPPATSWLELLAFLLMAIVLIILLPRKGPGYGVMIFLAGTIIVWMASLVAFSQAKTLFDPSFATVRKFTDSGGAAHGRIFCRKPPPAGTRR